MEDKQKRLRELPQIHQTQQALQEELEDFPSQLALAVIREQTQQWRQEILEGTRTRVPVEQLYQEILTQLEQRSRPHLQSVINGTGVVLHTNLGRAPLSEEAVAAVAAVARGYSNLEMDLETGQRGQRYHHVEKLLCQLTGAEAALVVNNNAGATTLALDTLAKGKPVVISRGELVEIGGSFRIPDILQASGCELVEVGTTNRTHLRDYEQAITPTTGALLKVHTSNYEIVGFSKSVPLDPLYQLGEEHHLPVIVDLGSGLLADLSSYGIGAEPLVKDQVARAHVVCFSGDKLLGGPQAGIIVGKKEYLAPMSRNPLLRALRIDKMSLAALEATLRAYLSPKHVNKTIPALAMLTVPLEELEERGANLVWEIGALSGWTASLVSGVSPVGGGALPGVELETCLVALTYKEYSASELQQALRRVTPPVVTRVENQQVLVDVRTLLPSQGEHLLTALRQVE